MLLFDYSVSNSVHTHMFKLVATLCLIVRACIHIVNTIIIKIIFIVITKWFSQDVHINSLCDSTTRYRFRDVEGLRCPTFIICKHQSLQICITYKLLFLCNVYGNLNP